MDKQEIERLTKMEQKIDRNSKKLSRLEKNQDQIDQKLDKTHDAVLQLPTTLKKHYVTREEHKGTIDKVADLENDRKWIVRLLLTLLVTAIVSGVLIVNS